MWVGRVSVNILPDDVLLLIFHFDRVTYLDGLGDVDPLWLLSWRWHRLVHVCREWRSVVFASPKFLDLKLVCNPWTRVELTGIWPPLPVIIRHTVDWPMPEDYDFDAVISLHNRVSQIHLLDLTSSQLQRLASTMQKPFPVLIHLLLDFLGHYSYPAPAPALPDGFLGGSAPRLRYLGLHSIPFPALPKLLLSTTHLVRLSLRNIPHSGYFSPEAVVTGLVVLANLKYLTIGFQSPLSCPNRLGEVRRPPPLTRTVLPALIRFEFKGASEYLEGLVARIDAPLLDSIYITFFHQLIFNIPQLAQFMGRTTKFQALNEAHMDFDYSGAQVGYFPPTQTFDERSGLRISCGELDWQLSSVAQIVTSFFPSIDRVKHLFIYEPLFLQLQWQDDVENLQWLEILHPFTAVTSLCISKEFAQNIATTLQELVGERVTNVLPALESLSLEEFRSSEPVQEAIEQFVAARQRVGRPVAVSQWNRT